MKHNDCFPGPPAIAVKRSLRWLLVGFTAGALLGGGVPPAPGRSPAEASPAGTTLAGDFRELDSFLQDQIAALGIPGAEVAVVRDGALVHAAAFGRADDSGQPMTAQTPVLLASTSKSLTSIAVMQQVEAGCGWMLRCGPRIGCSATAGRLPWLCWWRSC